MLFVFATTVSAEENWILSTTSNYSLTFTCTAGCGGVYPHTLDVSIYDVNDGSFTGVGYYNVNPAITWTVSNGDINGDNISFTVDYDSSAYYVDLVGTIASSGAMSGTAGNATQSFTWTMSPNAVFNRRAEITAPDNLEVVSGNVTFSAFLMDDDLDGVQWAVRPGTCASGATNVWGNVDGHNDPYDWTYDGMYTQNFSSTVDTSSWSGGMYCFVFNPTEQAGDVPIRLTREFYIADAYVHGGGQIIEEVEGLKPADLNKISFGGWIWDLGGGNYSGDWEVNFHNVGDAYNMDKSKFHTTDILSMTFFTGDGSTCNDAMNFVAEGEWNGIPGYELTFRAGDFGSPNTLDTVRIELRNSSNETVYDTWFNWGGEFTNESTCVGTARTGLDNGNITIWQD